MNPLAIIGLGHVGLTLALTLAEEGLTVFGIEKSPQVLEHLKNIRPPFFERGLKEFLKKHLGKNLRVFDRLPDQEIKTYILSVGTPLKPEKKDPDLNAALQALRDVAQHMQTGSLVILRSTVPVGTSRKIFIPLLQETKKQFYYACCPERTCEGAALQELRELPQIIGGIDGPSFEMAMALFKKITPTVVRTPSLEGAEIVKLMDNCWRDTTFAFANEMALLCESLGLNAREAIEMANLGYSRNTIPQPGFVGGPCLTKDTFLLTQPANLAKFDLPLIQTARRMNEELPRHVCERIRQFVGRSHKDPENCKLFLSGLSFKGSPATDDLRGSPSLDLLKHLRQAGFRFIVGHDFMVSGEEIANLGLVPCSLEEGFKNADCVCLLNNHADYKTLNLVSLLRQMNRPALFFDAWHLFKADLVQEWPEITYGGIGF